MFSLSFKGIIQSVLVSVIVSGWLAFAMPTEAKAADATSVSWRVSGFLAGNNEWFARCKMVSTSDTLQLGSKNSQQLKLNDQDNNCLHLLASEITFTIVDHGIQSSQDRRLDVTLKRVATVPYYKGSFPWSDKVYETKVLSEDLVQLSCRQYVRTVFGFVNPVGMRALDCLAVPGSPIELQIRFADPSLWIR